MAKKNKNTEQTKKEWAARAWVPPEDTAPAPPTEPGKRQRRQPNRNYTSNPFQLSRAEVNQRTKCLCEKPNVVYDPAEKREYCFKCGKAPRKGTK